MNAVATAPPSAGPEPVLRPQPAPPQVTSVFSAAERTYELDTIATRWQLALDAAQRALNAAGGHFGLPPGQLERRRGELVRERQETERLLVTLARETRVPPPWLSSVPLTPQLLGLDGRTVACVFDLEGVLTDASILHASAWADAFDAFLLRFSERAGWHYRPFDRIGDYRAYVEGRPRLEGVHAFLESRGIRLPEGRPDDPSSEETANALAKRKAEALAALLRRRGVRTLPGARRYLEACGYAGVGRAVVSASATASSMIDASLLTGLIDVRVDAAVIGSDELRAPPAPDVVAAACRRLGVEPADTVCFTHTPAGVAAAHGAGGVVFGVADGAEEQLLRDYGAERVVPSLESLLRPVGA